METYIVKFDDTGECFPLKDVYIYRELRDEIIVLLPKQNLPKKGTPFWASGPSGLMYTEDKPRSGFKFFLMRHAATVAGAVILELYRKY